MSTILSERIEFFRNACILVPETPSDDHETILLPGNGSGKKKHRLFCSCCRGKTPTCNHARILAERYAEMSAGSDVACSWSAFEHSLAGELFSVFSRVQTNPPGDRGVVADTGNGEPLLLGWGSEPVLAYHSTGPDRDRLLSRCLPGERMSRAWLVSRLLPFVESEYEQAMRSGGHLTVRQCEEGAFWTRVAYHCFREFSADALSASVKVDGETGEVRMVLACAGERVLSAVVPKKAVPGVLEFLLQRGWESDRIAPAGDERELFFAATAAPDGSLYLQPVLRSSDSKTVPVLRRFCNGQFCYLPELDHFERFTYASLQRIATGGDEEVAVVPAEVDSFIKKNLSALSFASVEAAASGGDQQVDLFGSAADEDDLGRLIGVTVVRGFDRVELVPRSMENGIWTISIAYRYHNHSISLAALHEARRNRRRFCIADGCIVDLASENVAKSIAQAGGIGTDGEVTLSGASLLLLGRGSLTFNFDGDKRLIRKIKSMFSGKTEKPYVAPKDLTVTLREYQTNGVAWLLFLFDNYLGGLLCDEMGLGKTVQVIVFLQAVKQQRESGAFCCVVCPTSVVSHWSRLLARFAPALRVVDYTGADRSFPEADTVDVLVTTYGIMRNDAELLERYWFEVVVFDEIQQLKNSRTAGFTAAQRLKRRCAIGLTGTPVENSIDDLRTLFDLVLPGFSGELPDQTALSATLDGSVDDTLLARLKTRVAPFILRRMKKTVLTELPPKIEETRYCRLSALQREIYHEALATRGSRIIASLRDTDEPVPYMHIFSLMSFLKQICNTPALAAGTPEQYTELASGKWELFTELLAESLDSGEKVVVFTQFLGMVEIFKHYCASLDVGAVALTGSTRNRGELLRRFAEDESCRVFIGSLKAGGVGIDLVAASVVIHYDRWWNAAREDQATDRVHRIGQSRGVQVFRLVTENSIEERIHAIIERKRELAESMLSEDDPETVKQFSREELLELLSGV